MHGPRFPAGHVNPSLRMMWRPAVNFAKQGEVLVAEDRAMSPDALNSLFSLCIGFALAGALASGYQALGRRAEDVCGGAVPGVCRALHHHAQYVARRKGRAPPCRIRDAGNRARGVLE